MPCARGQSHSDAPWPGRGLSEARAWLLGLAPRPSLLCHVLDPCVMKPAYCSARNQWLDQCGKGSPFQHRLLKACKLVTITTIVRYRLVPVLQNPSCVCREAVKSETHTCTYPMFWYVSVSPHSPHATGTKAPDFYIAGMPDAMHTHRECTFQLNRTKNMGMCMS